MTTINGIIEHFTRKTKIYKRDLYKVKINLLLVNNFHWNISLTIDLEAKLTEN